jgi:hypothetical protein
MRRDDRSSLGNQRYGEGGSIRPLAIAAAIKDMKALLHYA